MDYYLYVYQMFIKANVKKQMLKQISEVQSGALLTNSDITWRRQWHPTPVLLPGKSHGWRSLVGCSPWGRKESDMTEWLHFHSSLSCIGEGNGNPLQCSFLENPRNGGAWWAAVYGVTQSWTRLKWLSSSSSRSDIISHLFNTINNPAPPRHFQPSLCNNMQEAWVGISKSGALTGGRWLPSGIGHTLQPLCGWSYKMSHVHLKGMYILFFCFACDVLKISIKSNCSIVSFRISVALLIFLSRSVHSCQWDI